MGRGKTHPLDAGELSERSEQLSKAMFFIRIAVRIHVLPEELNFSVAEVSELERFRENRRGSAAALFSTSKRNNAVGAEFVAAFDDRDVAAMRISPGRELGLKAFVGLPVVESGYALLTRLQLHQHLREIPVRC